MRRWLFTFVSTLSLLLFGVTCMLWVRSGYGLTDVVTASRGGSWSLFSSEGTLCGQQVFLMKGTTGTAAVAPVSDRWRIGTDGEVYSPRFHRMMDTGTGSQYYGRFSPARSAGPYDVWSQVWVRFVAAPHWAVACASGVLPVAWLVAAHRRRDRLRLGRCARCGYDLRATPDRCPECGAEPAQ